MPRLRHRNQTPPSRLEARFMRIWEAAGGPPLEREILFHPERRWRADFAHIPSRVLFEVDGGVFSYGRHTRGAGFVADCEKHLAAWLLGWSVVRLTSRQLTTDNVERAPRALTSVGIRCEACLCVS
jgi:hypothetical protein